MKILHHRYTLTPGPDRWQALPAPREGALLRVEFDDGSTGHADLHPWPELGQPRLELQLSALATGSPTPQGTLALRHARTDAAARRAGRSLFDGLPPVRSHALFTNWTDAPRAAFETCAASGFRSAKLKVGRNPTAEAAALNAMVGMPLRWRLDANALFTAEEFRAWAAFLDEGIRRAVDFVEDPCIYDNETWSSLADATGLSLALDWQLPATPPPWPGASNLVLKPSTQEAFPLADAAARAGLNLVVTHSLDHPLGRATALWTAMRLRQRHADVLLECGLGGADHAPIDGWPTADRSAGPLVEPPEGTGFGYDDLLGAIRWHSL